MASRKTAETREKELRLAIHRIERGRAHTKADEVSISSVAREAGVSAALIHNHYPIIAELIRIKQGVSSRQIRDAKQAEVLDLKNKNAEMRRKLEELQSQLAKLATINEMLVVDNTTLRASLNANNIVRIDNRKR